MKSRLKLGCYDAVALLKQRAGKHNVQTVQSSINENLRTDDNYYNRELCLRSGKDFVWKEISETNKYSITMTNDSTITLEYPSHDIETLYRTLVNQSGIQGIPNVSKRWISDLIRLGMYKIALMRSEGAVIAATMVKSFKKTVSFPFTCTYYRNHGGSVHM
jgi:hypothetical protein